MAEFILPYKTGKVTLTSRFGQRIINDIQDNHKGVDLCGSDKVLVAPCDGVIGSSTMITDKSNNTWEWGNYIRIDRDDGLKIFMCHMKERKVKVGQRVKAGDIVGVEGYTGYCIPAGPKGSHCHFEVRRNGVSINPAPLLGIPNEWGIHDVSVPDYAALVVKKCGLEPKTKAYINAYKYANDLWRKLWEQMK